MTPRANDLRSYFRDLASHLQELERAIPQLERVLSQQTSRRGFGSPSPQDTSGASTAYVGRYLGGLSEHLGALEDSVPTMERALRSSVGQRGEWGTSEANDLRAYMQSIRHRLEELHYAMPRLESALQRPAASYTTGYEKRTSYAEQASRASSGAVQSSSDAESLQGSRDAGTAASMGGERLQLSAPSSEQDLRVYLGQLRERLEALRYAFPRLEQALDESARGMHHADLEAWSREMSPPEPGPQPELWPEPEPEPEPGPEPRPQPAAAATAWRGRSTGEDERATLRQHETTGNGYRLRESVWSQRKLRWLVLLLAALLLLALLTAAAYFNPGYQRQVFAQNTVMHMRNASSYNAVGIDTLSAGTRVQEIREQFSYVAPAQARTKFLTSAQQNGRSVPPRQCADKDVVVVNGTRYQRCNDAGADAGWIVDSFDAVGIFDTPQFQPWMRFLWCREIEEHDELQIINGVETRPYSCQVREEDEANIIWQDGASDDPDVGVSREKFVKTASVNMTVWVRQNDGYIGRFAMVKTWQGKDDQEIRQTVDYVYSDFNQLSNIQPPDTSSNSGEGQEQAEAAPTPDFAVLNGHRITLEVADTQEEISRGLANRSSLPRDQGMLFVLPQETTWTFWMKDVQFPVDAIFLDSDLKVVDIKTMEPEPGVPDSQLTRYQVGTPSKYAIEINAGLAQSFGLERGMQVELLSEG